MKNKLKVQIYEPKSKVHNPVGLLVSVFMDFKHGRYLAWRLFVRNLTASYRQSILGLFWVVIPPIITSFFWIFLKSQNVFEVGDTEISYALFVFTGVMLWQMFLDALNIPLKNFQQSKSMLVKINFPREAILLSAFYEVVFNLLIKLLLITIMLIWFQVEITWGWTFFIIGLIGIITFGNAISVFVLPISLLYGDVQRVISIGSQFLFFLTPVIYPIPKTGISSKLLDWNPLAVLIDFTRDNLLLGITQEYLFFVVVFVSLLGLISSVLAFRLSLPYLIERIGS